ncbi:hypothetical protein VPNG_01986 [Cytospora leucostoma]|uniref:Uncharacterized protein n=1 Tax=Cytospora leucostoma TaxID=1230097 RepID=A0A423XIM6_9PEZI|nr:hypothetical protein VPNG_01986 [Cytospora leucostoma]
MSRLGLNGQMLSRCGSRLTSMGAVAPSRIATPLCHSIRQASTTKSTKAQTASKKTAKGSTPAATKPNKASTKTAAASQKPVPIAEVTKAARPARNVGTTPAKAPEPAVSPSAETQAAEASTAGADLPATMYDARPRVDTSSKEYKKAERSWTNMMVALPILIVTSYFLFERLLMGKNPSLNLSHARRQPVPAPTPASAPEDASNDGA